MKPKVGSIKNSIKLISIWPDRSIKKEKRYKLLILWIKEDISPKTLEALKDNNTILKTTIAIHSTTWRKYNNSLKNSNDQKPTKKNNLNMFISTKEIEFVIKSSWQRKLPIQMLLPMNSTTWFLTKMQNYPK